MQGYTVTADEGITVTLDDESTNGLTHDGTIYAGNSDTVTLSISGGNTKDGYRFTGYTASAGTLTESGGKYSLTMPEGNVTISTEFAQLYSVTISDAITNGTITADKTQAFEDDVVTLTPTKAKGYEAENLTVMAGDSAVDVTDNADGTYTFTMPAGAVTVNFTLKPITYHITYTGIDGVTFTAQNPTEYTIESDSFTLNNPTKEGYTFTGWTGEGLDGSQMSVTIQQGSTGAKTFTSNFTANTYTVKFDSNKGAGEMDSQSYTYDSESAALTANTFTREGYTFAGWNMKEDGSGSSYTDGQEVANLAAGGEITLYAQWTAITYTITYNLDGGTADNPASYTIESESFTLTNPTKDGFTFAGWTDKENDEPRITVTIQKGSTGNLEFTAAWTKNGFSPKDSSTPEFVYHSLILSGQIGVIFHVYAPEGLESKDCCMYFDVSGDKSQNTQPVYAFETMTDDGKNFLGFTCYINSVQMADKIHAELHYKDTNGTEKTITHDYTANQYLSYIIGDTTQAADTIALAEAIMDYGHYVQPVLASHNGWEIGKHHAEMTPANDYDDTDFTATETATQQYAITNTRGDSSGISDLKFALILDSETTIELYLTPKDDYTGEVYAYLDGGNINMAVKNGDQYTVSIENISAHKLGETHTIEITTKYPNADLDSFTVKISALSYVYSAIQQDDTDMKRAVTSLYRYHDSTMTYRKNRPNIYGTN